MHSVVNVERALRDQAPVLPHIATKGGVECKTSCLSYVLPLLATGFCERRKHLHRALSKLTSPHGRSDKSGLSRPRFLLTSAHQPTACTVPAHPHAQSLPEHPDNLNMVSSHVPRGKEGYLHDLQPDPCICVNRCDIAIGPAAGSGEERHNVKQTSTFAIMWKQGNIQKILRRNFEAYLSRCFFNCPELRKVNIDGVCDISCRGGADVVWTPPRNHYASHTGHAAVNQTLSCMCRARLGTLFHEI